MEVRARFEIVWDGTSYLLGDYASDSTLMELARTPSTKKRSANPMIRVRPHGGGAPKKYTEPLCQAMRALRQDGFNLREISARLGIPLRSVHQHLMERRV